MGDEGAVMGAAGAGGSVLPMSQDPGLGGLARAGTGVRSFSLEVVEGRSVSRRALGIRFVLGFEGGTGAGWC